MPDHLPPDARRPQSRPPCPARSLRPRLALPGLCAAAALWGCGDGGAAPRSGATVERGPFEVTVTESCEFRPLKSWVMLARTSDKIDWLVPEGALVKPGDPVFTQDRTSQREWLARDSNELEAARRNLNEVRRQVQMELDEIGLGLESRTSAVDLARTRLEEARSGPGESDLAQADAAIAAAETVAKERRAAAAAAAELLERGFLSGAEADAEAVAAQIADIGLERSRLRLTQLKAGVGPHARRIAELQLERVRAELTAARAQAAQREADLAGRITDAQAQVASLERSVARAERSITSREVAATGAGLVIFRALRHRSDSKVEVGTRVWNGAGVMDIADTSRMKVRTQLAERHIRYLRVGSRLRITVDSFPGPALEARVTWIDRWSRDRSADLAKADRAKEGLSGVKVFALEAALEDRDDRLKPGFKGRAEFPLVSLPEALIVPGGALFGPAHERHVRVIGPDGERRVPVEVLAEDDRNAAVQGALRPGERLRTREAP